MAETETQAARETPAFAGVPSKPHNAHKQHRKVSDPFLHLDEKPESSPLSKEDFNAKYNSNSLLTDVGCLRFLPQLRLTNHLVQLILTPLNMITFVLSLSVIDFRQRQWRLSQHASDHETFWFQLTYWSSLLHPEPYQDSRDSTWKHNDKTALQSPPNTAFQGWYTQKKHRAVTKMEISDAFEMRGRVFVALLAWAAVGVFGLTFVVKRLYRWVSGT